MSTLKLGWASRDISTDKPVLIPGQAHARVSKGVLDPLTATTLIVDDGNDCVIFLSIDTVSIRKGLLSEIREKLKAARPEIPGEKILSNATHAHTGASHNMGNMGFETTEKPPVKMPVNVEVASGDEYRDWLSTMLSEMIIEAWDKKCAGGIAYGYGYAVVSHSRRECYFDDLSKRGNVDKLNTFAVNGTAAMYGNTNDDNFSHYEAGADHFINLMYTFDEAGQLTGAIINVPCPSQNSEMEWYLSSDYWNDVRVAIRKKYGNIFILPQCAAAGDLSPRILHYKKAQDRRFRLKYGDCQIDPRVKGVTEMYARKDIAERIAAAFEEVYSWAKNDIKTDVKVSHKVSMVELDQYRITEDDLEYSKDGLATSKAQSYVKTDDKEADMVKNTAIVSNRNRFLSVIKRYESQKTTTTRPMEMHVLRIGDIAFATNRFELYMDFQHRIQARSPFEQTFIVQLVGQPNECALGGGYLCTERAFEGRGYSAIVFSIQTSPKGGQQLVEETVKQLKELYAE